MTVSDGAGRPRLQRAPVELGDPRRAPRHRDRRGCSRRPAPIGRRGRAQGPAPPGADGGAPRRPGPRRRRGQRPPGRSEGDMVAQRREPRRADAAHLVELRHRAEAAVLDAVVDDALAERRADPVERLELLEGRRVERDRRGRDAAPSAPAAGAGRRPRRGTTTCSPSVRRAARFSASRSARRPGRALRTASSTRAPAGRRYTPARRTSPLTSTTSDLRSRSSAPRRAATTASTGYPPPPPPPEL